MRSPGPLLLAAALLASAGEVRAADLPPLAGEPVTVDVTNTAIFDYHFDNRNDAASNVATRVDDNYAEWLDRLNVQVGWWRLRLGVRFDAATYVADTSLAEAQRLARRDLRDRPADALHANDYYRELNTRFLDTYYPAKLSLSYTQPGVEATVGDFYAQLGRGLVFSARKIDELSVDTTVRGGKVVADHSFGSFRIGATALAGQLNPLRIEETSGRRLNGEGSPLFFGFPKARDLAYYQEGPTRDGLVTVVDQARPNYLEDTVYGGHVEAGGTALLLGVNGSVLVRKSFAEENTACFAACAATDAQCKSDCGAKYPNFSSAKAEQLHDTIRTFSGSVSLPALVKWGDFYAEVAGQQLRDGHPSDSGQREADLSGYAVYASANVHGGPVTVSVEGKHYRRFFPLSGNVDVNTQGFNAPEYSLITYNSPPTAEPIYVEPVAGGAPQVCNTGGRTRVDYRFTPDIALYAWAGYYVSYSEISLNNACDADDKLKTNTWDNAAGVDIGFERSKSHVKAWVGIRDDTRAVPSDATTAIGLTSALYREGYIRYDVTKHITGPFSVQAQGFHRKRYEPSAFAEPWYEGENYTALQWSPHWAGIVGYEYSTRQGCRPDPTETICHYVNGGVQWKSGSNEKVVSQIFDTVNLFVGQRRGAIRCVSGVCRLFPPFEGAKIEIVSRF